MAILKIAKRRSDRPDDSDTAWLEILRAMRAAGPDSDVESLRRQFMEHVIRHRRQSPEAAGEMWAALRRRPELIPQTPPSGASSE